MVCTLARLSSHLTNTLPQPSRMDLKEFFQHCDSRELGTEPEWQEHLTMIQHSKSTGQSWNSLEFPRSYAPRRNAAVTLCVAVNPSDLRKTPSVHSAFLRGG